MTFAQNTARPPAAAAAGARRPLSALAIPRLLVVLFVVSLPAVTPRIYASDEVQYFAFLRSLWFDHDLSFDNEYRHFYESGAVRTAGFKETFLDTATRTGLRENFGTIGCALLWSPFYALADAGVRIARLAGSPVAADGYSAPYVAAAAYGSALYGFLALLLAVHACGLATAGIEPRTTPSPGTSGNKPLAGRESAARSGVDGSSGWTAMAAVWVGTPLLFYMYVAPVFSHAVSAFAVAAFVVTWLRVRNTWSARGMMALGALAALMTMVREQDVFVAGGALLDFAWAIVRRGSRDEGAAQDTGAPVRRLIGPAIAGVLTAAIVYLPQAITYVRINGRLGPSTLVSRKMSWTSPHAAQVLASPEHGFFWWTPLAALAVAGLVMAAIGAAGRRDGRERARVAVCLLTIVALEVYVAGAVGSWSVAGAFGQRRFVALTSVLVVGVAALLRSARRPVRRAAALAAVVVAAWWNIALVVQFGTGLMDRQRLTLTANAYNAFVVVPRELPRLAYRYAFDRKSFYAPRHEPAR